MFEPRKAEAIVERSHPSLSNVQIAINKVRRLHSTISASAIIKDAIGGKVKQKKLESSWKLSERITRAQDFLISWNAWRNYFDHEARPFVPTCNSTMTQIETIKEFAEDQNVDLDILLGCGFMAWRGRAPHLSVMAANMMVYYTEQADKVINDIENASGALRSLTEENF